MNKSARWGFIKASDVLAILTKEKGKEGGEIKQKCDEKRQGQN